MQRLRERENNRLEDGQPLPLRPTQIVYCDHQIHLAILQGRLAEIQSYGETAADRSVIAQAMSDMFLDLTIAELEKLGHL